MVSGVASISVYDDKSMSFYQMCLFEGRHYFYFSTKYDQYIQCIYILEKKA